MKFVPLDETLLRLIEPRDDDLASLLNDPAQWRTACAHGIGVIDGPHVLGAFGLLPLWRGRAIAWLVISWRVTPRQVARALPWAKGWIDRQAIVWQRIEATALTDQPRACAFLERLGFEREGTMRKWGPGGEDHVLYARIGVA